jgi:4-hydroxybenzoyl-CoA reductase subunit beta
MTALMTGLRLAKPCDIAEAIAIRVEHPDSRFLAGGTDLIVNLRRRIGTPQLLVDLSGISALTELKPDEDGLVIGAGVTLAALVRDPAIGHQYRALAQAAAAVAAPGHRNMATIGGNLCLDTRCIYYNQSEWWRNANDFCLKCGGDTCHVAPQGQRCHAAFCGDLAPALLVLGAEIDVSGIDGSRRVPLSELYVEDGRSHLALSEGELLVAIHLPASPPPSAYAKVRQRSAIDFPLAGVAVALTIVNTTVASLRIALTGTNSRPFLLADTERFAGRTIDETLLHEIDRLVQQQVRPMRTTIVAANYRRIAGAAVARRLISGLFEESNS